VSPERLIEKFIDRRRPCPHHRRDHLSVIVRKVNQTDPSAVAGTFLKALETNEPTVQKAHG
jgi:hypothetical protein